MKVVITGDYVPRCRLASLIKEEKYKEIFGEIKPIIDASDYAILNFESPIVSVNDKPIQKCGPNLQCKPEAVDAIKWAGFNCVTLANNHIRDWGDSAVERTMRLINSHGMDFVGAGENIDAARLTLYVKVNGKKLAIINCCENEFSIATNKHYGANPLNPVKQYYSIQEAKKKADFVLMIVHGGHEHYQLPSPRMQDTYRFFIDAGANIVVNHHQHCYSGYEIYKDKPIVYGTGNFCMDKDPVRIGQIWNYGYMVLWDTDNASDIRIIPYEQCGEIPSVHLLDDDAFDDKLKELNEIISNRALLVDAIEKYYKKSETTINNVLEPIQNKYIAALQYRHWLPSLISQRWLLKLQDFILCESHRDKMEYFFKDNNK